MFLILSHFKILIVCTFKLFWLSCCCECFKVEIWQKNTLNSLYFGISALKFYVVILFTLRVFKLVDWRYPLLQIAVNGHNLKIEQQYTEIWLKALLLCIDIFKINFSNTLFSLTLLIQVPYLVTFLLAMYVSSEWCSDFYGHTYCSIFRSLHKINQSYFISLLFLHWLNRYK